MSQLKQPLPQPLPAGIVYEAVLIEDAAYDPIARQYRARVFGICKGRPLPLILNTAVQLRHIEEVVVTDAEIDQVLAVRPDLNSDRVSGALAASFRRLYELANEQPEEPQ